MQSSISSILRVQHRKYKIFEFITVYINDKNITSTVSYSINPSMVMVIYLEFSFMYQPINNPFRHYRKNQIIYQNVFILPRSRENHVINFTADKTFLWLTGLQSRVTYSSCFSQLYITRNEQILFI